MKDKIPDQLVNNNNSTVLAYLDGKSCHGDIVEPLQACFSRYQDVAMFRSNSRDFGYCFWYLRDRVFAFATGMTSITLWLPDPLERHLMASMESALGEVGEDWYSIPYNSFDLHRLAELAYCAAK